MGFFVLTVKYVLKVLSSCKLFEIFQELMPDFCLVCHECGMKLRPFDITLTWLLVSWWLEKYARHFSLVSFLCFGTCVAFFWGILHLWFLGRQLLFKRFVVVADGSENTML